MKALRWIYYKLVPTYRILEKRCVSHNEAFRMMTATRGQPIRWRPCDQEPTYAGIGFVWMERRERITS